MPFLTPNSTIDVAVPANQTLRLAIINSTAQNDAVENISVIRKVLVAGSSSFSLEPLNSVSVLNNQVVDVPTSTVDRIINLQAPSYSNLHYAVGSGGLAPSLDTLPALTFGTAQKIDLISCASTFVTLTADSDPSTGLVRLTSAGAHGLTAAAAIGKQLYVTWTGGTGVTGFYTITAIPTDTTGLTLTINMPFVSGLGTASVNLATVAVPIYSFVVPARRFQSGQTMFIQSVHGYTASTDNKTVTFSLGGVTIGALVNATASAVSSRIYKSVSNRNDTTLVSDASGSFGTGVSTSALVASALSFTQDNTFLMRFTPAVANQAISLESLRVVIQ